MGSLIFIRSVIFCGLPLLLQLRDQTRISVLPPVHAHSWGSWSCTNLLGVIFMGGNLSEITWARIFADVFTIITVGLNCSKWSPLMFFLGANETWAQKAYSSRVERNRVEWEMGTNQLNKQKGRIMLFEGGGEAIFSTLLFCMRVLNWERWWLRRACWVNDWK